MIPYWVGIIWIILAGMTGITVGLYLAVTVNDLAACLEPCIVLSFAVGDVAVWAERFGCTSRMGAMRAARGPCSCRGNDSGEPGRKPSSVREQPTGPVPEPMLEASQVTAAEPEWSQMACDPGRDPRRPGGARSSCYDATVETSGAR